MTTSRSRRSYDHRIRQLICETRNPQLFAELQIPRSTVRSWLRRGTPSVVTSDLVSDDKAELLAEIQELRQRVALLAALVTLFVAMLRVWQLRLPHERLPEGRVKRTLLRAIERGARVLPRSAALRILRLSPARYHSWRRGETPCQLDDRPSCPRSLPTRLTSAEVERVKDMVQSEEHRHMSIRALALHAQRIGKVFAAPSTWHRLAAERGWRRPRQRVYPAKAKLGIRATAPNQYWHLDVTIIRLQDGTRAYLHAVIDNFSRRILAWTLEEHLGGAGTCRILMEASRHLNLAKTETMLVTDSGSENVNREVNGLLQGQPRLDRVLAQVDIIPSNSMIEAFWRSLKNAWIYLHSLDNMATLRRLIEFYITAHNQVMPHAAFDGQTPDEMYFGTGDTVEAQLTVARVKARAARMAANRAAACGVCSDGLNPSTPAAIGPTLPPED